MNSTVLFRKEHQQSLISWLPFPTSTISFTISRSDRWVLTIDSHACHALVRIYSGTRWRKRNTRTFFYSQAISHQRSHWDPMIRKSSHRIARSCITSSRLVCHPSTMITMMTMTTRTMTKMTIWSRRSITLARCVHKIAVWTVPRTPGFALTSPRSWKCQTTTTLARFTVAPAAAAVARVGVWHNTTALVISSALCVDLAGCHEIHATTPASSTSIENPDETRRKTCLFCPFGSI